MYTETIKNNQGTILIQNIIQQSCYFSRGSRGSEQFLIFLLQAESDIFPLFSRLFDCRSIAVAQCNLHSVAKARTELCYLTPYCLVWTFPVYFKLREMGTEKKPKLKKGQITRMEVKTGFLKETVS